MPLAAPEFKMGSQAQKNSMNSGRHDGVEARGLRRLFREARDEERETVPRDCLQRVPLVRRQQHSGGNEGLGRGSKEPARCPMVHRRRSVSLKREAFESRGMRGRIEELKDEIKDLIERQEAVKDPSEKMVYQDLIAEKGEELEDLEREFEELARQYV